jgi:hypothetical protein
MRVTPADRPGKLGIDEVLKQPRWHRVANELGLALEPEEKRLGDLTRGQRRWFSTRPPSLHDAIYNLELNAELFLSKAVERPGLNPG